MGKIVQAIGLIIIGIANLVGIIDVIYMWAHSMTFPQALWDGLVLWFMVIGGGVIIAFSGIGIRVIEGDL